MPVTPKQLETRQDNSDFLPYFSLEGEKKLKQFLTFNRAADGSRLSARTFWVFTSILGRYTRYTRFLFCTAIVVLSTHPFWGNRNLEAPRIWNIFPPFRLKKPKQTKKAICPFSTESKPKKPPTKSHIYTHTRGDVYIHIYIYKGTIKPSDLLRAPLPRH